MSNTDTGSAAEPVAARPTAREMVRSLTGWDEIAIERKFESKMTDLATTMAARAAVFVQLRREGNDDANAYGLCMNMPMGEVEDFFADEPAADEEPGKA